MNLPPKRILVALVLVAVLVEMIACLVLVALVPNIAQV